MQEEDTEEERLRAYGGTRDCMEEQPFPQGGLLREVRGRHPPTQLPLYLPPSYCLPTHQPWGLG